ncbi:hypothetical protein M2480_002986 [Parabacteroides sp. PFB2-12]|uniref:porin family protein n=1 Tax=unclassified Parabacteroides TaxID=2649774 RepID=UPI002474AD92|nr:MULTISPECIES: porin family protein [unclassified Parabacteroides]MDH6343426.1 hypothetical protein [Parabacteroides sp. PM6-13]MDH6391982.1 hypothetical protein [Parabacteroides sp. PFB2-12]
MKLRYFILLVAGCALLQTARAQEESTRALEWSTTHGLEYSLKAGFNIGGTAPIPFPEEIREIKGYSPKLNLLIEGDVTKWFNSRWGALVGIRLETKAMDTKAQVKNYGMELSIGGEPPVTGRWTGMVKTNVSHTYLSVPLLATYKISPRWKLQGGAFLSYMFDGDFSGEVYDGYLRDGDPTGEKTVIDGEQKAFYDFSDELRSFQWGAQVGAEWRAFKKFTVNANLTWGLNDAFKRDFKTITFAMYPIYLNAGFGYVF